MSANDTQTKKLEIAPGINKNTTELDAEGIYVSCDKIRFYYGKPEKLGGWQKETYSGSVKGVARDAHTWVDLEERSYLGFGTNEKLYLFEGGELSDITPIRSSASVSDVLNTSAGSNIVTVSIPAHGAAAGDYVIFTCVTASLDGSNFLAGGEYQVISAETNSFTVSVTATAVSGCANAGGLLIADFLLNNGLESNGAAFGWGAGTWNTPGASASAGWSDPRGGTGTSANLRQWSSDNWGEDGIFNIRGGNIYRWEASAGKTERAKLMASAAPSIVNIAIVAQEGRHVIAYGTHNVSGDFDPLLVRWSDSEDFTKWTAAATNQAGEFRLENGSFIIGVQESRREILVFTDESVYSMRRVGGNFVFSFTDLGTHNGLQSQHAAIDVNGVVYWMGYNSFHYYDGRIHTLPCSLQEFLFNSDSEGSINSDQKEKVFCATNKEFNEIWWFYPSKNSDENDRYVIFNYLEKTWYHGTMERTVWHDVDIFAKPYALDSSGNIYIHEQGKDDDAAGMQVFLQTSFFDLDDGGEIMFVDRVIPDSTITKEVFYNFSYKKYPQATEEFSKGPFQVTPTTRKFHPRIRGRQAQITYSTSIQGADFRIGSDRVSLKPDGKR